MDAGPSPSTPPGGRPRKSGLTSRPDCQSSILKIASWPWLRALRKSTTGLLLVRGRHRLHVGHSHGPVVVRVLCGLEVSREVDVLTRAVEPLEQHGCLLSVESCELVELGLAEQVQLQLPVPAGCAAVLDDRQAREWNLRRGPLGTFALDREAHVQL